MANYILSTISQLYNLVLSMFLNLNILRLPRVCTKTRWAWLASCARKGRMKIKYQISFSCSWIWRPSTWHLMWGVTSNPLWLKRKDHPRPFYYSDDMINMKPLTKKRKKEKRFTVIKSQSLKSCLLEITT